MESLTGISFPRNEGTCTRNVFDVKSKHNKDLDYKCVIKLRFICDDKTDTELKNQLSKNKLIFVAMININWKSI